jgi:hypothetical protein
MANSLALLSPDKHRDDILSEPRAPTVHEELQDLDFHKLESEHRITL